MTLRRKASLLIEGDQRMRGDCPHTSTTDVREAQAGFDAEAAPKRVRTGERIRYRPRLSWRPIVAVRWRSCVYAGPVRRRWRLFLFGVVPVASLPRVKGCPECRRHGGECQRCYGDRR